MGITDILEELNIAEVALRAKSPKKVLNPLEDVPEQLSFATVDDGDEGEPEEQVLLSQLTDSPAHIDDIQRSSGLPITTVSGTLTMLELKGNIKQVGCMHYIRIRETTAVYDN